MECKVGQWQDINGYNGFYQVNKCGDVKSLARSVKTKGNKIKENKEGILKQAISQDGCGFDLQWEAQNE